MNRYEPRNEKDIATTMLISFIHLLQSTNGLQSKSQSKPDQRDREREREREANNYLRNRTVIDKNIFATYLIKSICFLGNMYLGR